MNRSKRKTLRYGEEGQPSEEAVAEPKESSGIRRRKGCFGPAWLAEEGDRFAACPKNFVCDDPACADHDWSDDDRVLLRELRNDKEALLKVHQTILERYGPRGIQPDPLKTRSSLAAFLRANSRLHTFVVRKAVARSRHHSV